MLLVVLLSSFVHHLAQPEWLGIVCLFAVVMVRSAPEHCLFEAFPDSFHESYLTVHYTPEHLFSRPGLFATMNTQTRLTLLLQRVYAYELARACTNTHDDDVQMFCFLRSWHLSCQPATNNTAKFKLFKPEEQIQ